VRLCDLVKIFIFSLKLKSSFTLFNCYLKQYSPPGNYLTFKNGIKIYFSSHKHDIITFMTIFGKREYGKIPKNSFIIDIGANIGVFTLYAIINGAKKVLAYEPSKEAFKFLSKNIMLNNFQNYTFLENKAVTSKDEDFVFISKQSSPYNQIYYSQDNSLTLQKVETISLNKIISAFDHKIDILKIDCEGLELDILKTLQKEYINRICEIRLEYHRNKKELFDLLNSYGFSLIHEKYCVAWFKNLN